LFHKALRLSFTVPHVVVTELYSSLTVYQAIQEPVNLTDRKASSLSGS